MTNYVASVVASAHIPEDLDWQAFFATYFPGRRRHDLEALTAYCAYRSAQEVDAVSDGLARTEAERGRQARPRYRAGKTTEARRSEVVGERLPVRARPAQALTTWSNATGDRLPEEP